MVFGRGAIDDYVRLLGIHDAAPIPCAARSLTLDEARAVDRGRILWMLSVLIFFTILYGGILLHAQADRQSWTLMGIALGAVGLILAAMIWHRLRKRRDYRDPHIRIEAGEAELVVAGPQGRDSRPYQAVTIAELLSVATKSSRSFTGILLDTRLGPIRLEDEHYKEGRAVAGAILKRLDALGLPVVPGAP
jgi:hypothetical protein